MWQDLKINYIHQQNFKYKILKIIIVFETFVFK